MVGQLLGGVIQSAPDNSVGFDTDSQVPASVASAFREEGYVFCLRYVSRGEESASDLSNAEAQGILDSGLALMPVQHVGARGWSPDQSLGASNGAHAAANVATVGFPSGVTVWCDLEGVIGGVAADVSAYCNAWAAAVADQGFAPGLYVGANSVLSGEELYDLNFQHYWRSMSDVPPVANRGYQMFQSGVQGPVNGISIDKDVTITDAEGGRVKWLVRSDGS